MEFLEGAPCPGGIGRELTSHLQSFPVSCVPGLNRPPPAPASLCLMEWVRSQVAENQGPPSHPRARPQQRLWEQVCLHGLPYPSGGTAASRGERAQVPPGVTLSWHLPQPHVDVCVLTCCPGTLSRVWWGGWRGGVDGGWRLGWGSPGSGMGDGYVGGRSLGMADHHSPMKA